MNHEAISNIIKIIWAIGTLIIIVVTHWKTIELEYHERIARLTTYLLIYTIVFILAYMACSVIFNV